MNGVKEENNIKFKQTSKGVWYYNGLTVYNDNLKSALVDAKTMMNEINKELSHVNKVDI